MCKLVDDHKYKKKGKFTKVCVNCGKETVDEDALNKLIMIMEARIVSLEAELASKRKEYPEPYTTPGTGGGWGGGGTVDFPAAGGGGGGYFTTTTDGTDSVTISNTSGGYSQTFSPANIKEGIKAFKAEYASIDKA